MRLSVRALTLAGLALAPGTSAACAVCFSGTDEYRMAFTLTTVFLTALPLVMVGSFAVWLRRQARGGSGAGSEGDL